MDARPIAVFDAILNMDDRKAANGEAVADAGNIDVAMISCPFATDPRRLEASGA